MKVFVAFAILLVAAVYAEEEVCHNHIVQACSQQVGGEFLVFVLSECLSGMFVLQG